MKNYHYKRGRFGRYFRSFLEEDLVMIPQAIVRQGFLWGLAVIYLFAFTSLYIQIPGLYGDNGLLPASYVLEDLSSCRDQHAGCKRWALNGECDRNAGWMSLHCKKACNKCQDASLVRLFKAKPTLLWFTPWLGLDTTEGMEFLCIVGIVVSMVLLVSQRCRDCINYFVLWLLYYSLFQVGQIFLWYQWDGLLLETGFLSIFIAPWNVKLSPWKWKLYKFKRIRNVVRRHDTISLWLIKWLLFRLMFASGVVKLSWMDPTWWDLTAMYWHYEAQCIPTPIAWYFHKLPKWFHRLSNVITYVIEIGLPFLFFVPIRSLRIFAYCGQVLLQLLILLTGNYNFFNLLTIVLCISLLDDRTITSRYTCQSSCRKKNQTKTGETAIVSKEDDAAVSDIVIDRPPTKDKGTVEETKIKTEETKTKEAFSPQDFTLFVTDATLASIWIGLLSLVIEIVGAFTRILAQSKASKSQRNSWLIQCTAMSLFALWLFSVTLDPLTDVSRQAKSSLPVVFRKWYQDTKYLELANSYGLFRSMTGVGGRREIVILGSNSTNDTWLEYNFRYKPGNPLQPPPFVAPHQPRLDWQMWFAALETFESNPWLHRLLYKLLQGEKDVLDLMGENPEFRRSPPKYIRTQLYLYHFTQNKTSLKDVMFDSSSTAEKAWWTREYLRDYTPFIVSNESTTILQNMLKLEGLYKKSVKLTSSGLIHSVIAGLRHGFKNTLPQNVINFMFFIVIILLVFKVWWRKIGRKFCSPKLIQLKEKCEPSLKKASNNLLIYKSMLSQRFTAATYRSPIGRLFRTQCFLAVCERLGAMYNGICIMLNRGCETVKSRVKALAPASKKKE